MKDASFQKTYTIKIHGISDGTDIPKIVGRELWSTLSRLSENSTLRFKFVEEDYYADPLDHSDMWPEPDTIKLNAPKPRVRSELSPGVDSVQPVR